jgi:hypothetical protein
MQRHHLLPRELLTARCFGPLFERIGRDRLGFEDFRRNGLLLPATERSAIHIGLPLHRGPHRDYNAMVCERVGTIEGRWAGRRLQRPDDALDEALMRLTLLQGALRRRLLAERAACGSTAAIPSAPDGISPSSTPWQTCCGGTRRKAEAWRDKSWESRAIANIVSPSRFATRSAWSPGWVLKAMPTRERRCSTSRASPKRRKRPTCARCT